MNTRYGGREGWKLSSRMSSSLRQLADRLDAWRQESRPEQRQKDNLLVNVLNP
jgi:hypothetical protein